MQNYMSLSVAVIMCATLVNTQTHRPTDRQTDRQLVAGYTIGSAS